MSFSRVAFVCSVHGEAKRKTTLSGHPQKDTLISRLFFLEGRMSAFFDEERRTNARNTLRSVQIPCATRISGCAPSFCGTCCIMHVFSAREAVNHISTVDARTWRTQFEFGYARSKTVSTTPKPFQGCIGARRRAKSAILTLRRPRSGACLQDARVSGANTLLTRHRERFTAAPRSPGRAI